MAEPDRLRAPGADPLGRAGAAAFPAFATERRLAWQSIRAILGSSRRALAALRTGPGGEERAHALGDAIAHIRLLVNDGLQRNRRLNEPPFPALLLRAREHLQSLRAAAPRAGDDFYRLLLLEADMLALAGDLEGGLRLLRLGVSRINFIQDYPLRDALLLRFMDFAFALGRDAEAAAAVLRDLAERRQMRLLDVHWSDRLSVLAGRAGGLRDPTLGRAAGSLRRVARIGSLRPRGVFLGLASLYLHRFARPRIRRALSASASPATGQACAVRGMGGAGDLLMMTPALRALARLRRHPVQLLLPARFAPLFEMNPDITARPIEDLPEDWQPPPGLIDLTDCPAVAGELLEAPQIITNRIEFFARGIGISAADLDRSGRRPFFEPTPADAADAERWLAARGLAGAPFVLIQAQPAESYRTWPRIGEAATELAKTVPVVVVHDRALAGFDHPGVHAAFGMAFGASLALACRASIIVGPDSAFIHLAGARAIPSVSVFGPTGGAVRTAAYPEAVVVAQAARFGCIPCWRNEFTPCRVTQGMRSICLDSLPPEPVVAAVRGLLENRAG